MSEMQPLPIATPPAMLEVNQVSPSLTSSTSEGHPAPVQNASLPKVPETLIPSSPISPALFGGVIERPEYPRISVVIPTRNEAPNLPHLFPPIPSIIPHVILRHGHSPLVTIQ